MAVVIASSAAAAKPVVNGPFHDEGTVFFADCGEFQILDRYVLDVTVRVFLDETGTPIRAVQEASGTDTFINSVTGKELPTTPFHNSALIDPTTHLFAYAGVIYRVTVPGSGLVFIDAGRTVLNQESGEVTFQAGPHQAFDGDVDGLCAALK
jgi:hypothetical protein